jgi:probable F420-dependent oxidoreductase
MTRLGVGLSSLHAFPLDDYLALVNEVEERGYDTAWAGESSGLDAVTVMTVIASTTRRLRVASGVIPVQTRSPIVLGQTAAALGHIAPGRVALGLGVSSPIIVGQWHGLPFTRPLAQLREAVTIIRAAADGQRVNVDGAFYRPKGFRLTVPPPPKPIAIYLGALGPRALELAGEIADGVLLNWLPPEAVAGSIEHLEAGAGRAGRSLEHFEIAAFIRACVTDEPEPVRRALAREITGYAIVDAYARFFRACGYGAEMDAIDAAWTAGDRAGAVERVSDRLLDGLGVIGSAEFCRDRIAEFAKAGLTQPVIIPFSHDPDPRPALLRTIRAFP